MMPEDLTNKVVAWASEVATYAAQLPSRQAREEYLAERGRELVVGAQAEGPALGILRAVCATEFNAGSRIQFEVAGKLEEFSARQ